RCRLRATQCQLAKLCGPTARTADAGQPFLADATPTSDFRLRRAQSSRGFSRVASSVEPESLTYDTLTCAAPLSIPCQGLANKAGSPENKKTSRGRSSPISFVRRDRRSGDWSDETDRKPGSVMNTKGETTMRFMVMVPASAESEAGVLP